MSDSSLHGRQTARDFLMTRRAKITPEEASLPVYGGPRRVPGLRREEVALLAGVSVDYYTRLEKGNLTGASDSVLDAVAHALRLDEAERSYLFDLARAAKVHRSRTPSRARSVRPSLQRMLEAMTDVPAIVCNGRLDLVGTNALGRALYAPVHDSPVRSSDSAPPNMARFVFLDPAARDLFVDHDAMASMTVELLRAQVGRTPHDKALSDLIGQLSTRSREFPRLWAAHDVRRHRTGAKSFLHPVVGELHLDYESMDLQADAGLVMTLYSAIPSTPSSDALRVLASWVATQHDPSGAGLQAEAPSASNWGGSPAL